MTLLPRTRIGLIARNNLARAGLSTILGEDYEIVPPDGDADLLVADLDDWPKDLALDRSVLALTESPSLARAFASADLPGWGAIRRDSDEQTIWSAVRCVLQGQVVCEADWLPVRAEQNAASSAELSPREQTVLQFVAQGLANKEIAARMGISVHTVKFYVAGLLEKLGAASRTEAVMDGIRQGLISV